MSLEVISDISQDEFVRRFVATNTPVVVRGIPFDAEKFTPEEIKSRLGDLTTQVYGSLFDLENITSLEEYIDDYFGEQNADVEDVPYVRWYNQLKEIDFVWGDEAFGRIADCWTKPNCIPDQGLLVPSAVDGQTRDPVSQSFPYRAIQVAARGARTRLHRDPFHSDAVVSQFHGTKLASLYRPERADELTESDDDNSFGGFVDVRANGEKTVSHEPDYQGTLEPGDMIFIPHGWLHDVIVTGDSISVTWNFVHTSNAAALSGYLENDPEQDSEFEVLQYFMQSAGLDGFSPQQIGDYVRRHA